MPSIVIPAHNEEAVLHRCLSWITETAEPGEFEIVIVCNGCTDRTPEIARAFPYEMTVLETPVGNKIRALNAGDEAASSYPRVYVDADVRTSTDDIRKVVAALEHGAMAAAPKLEIDLDGASRSVRSYYRIWTQLPYIADDLVGSGFYALSEAARTRLGPFPETFAEDLWVRNHFGAGERVSVDGARFIVAAPHTLRSLLRVRYRVVAANRRFARAHPGPLSGERRQQVLPRLRSKPELIPHAAVYGFVQAVGKVGGALRDRFGDVNRWDRDETARTASGQSG